MKHDVGYDWTFFEKVQKKFFNKFCDDIFDKGGNEYDAAALFVSTMVAGLDDISKVENEAQSMMHGAARVIPFMNLEDQKDLVFEQLLRANRGTK